MPVGMMQLSKLRKDGGTQQRAKLDYSVVSEYAERMKAGDDFPPVDVFYDGEEHWLASGFHREAAAREAGKKAIPAIMHKGTLREAILFSCGANSSHGLRRTNADKRKAVTTIVSDIEWSKEFSNRRIAEICCVGPDLVADVRTQLTESVNSQLGGTEKRVGRDGKKYNAKKPPKPRIETIEDDDEDTDTDDGTDIQEEPESEPIRPFAKLPSLPADVTEAIEALKLCCIRHRKNKWKEISQREFIAVLESLIVLAKVTSE